MKRRMVILVTVALLATMGGVACGNKTTTAPIELDTVPPAAVTGFGFQLNPTNDPNVTLTWNAGAELDLMGYNVYRMPVESEWRRTRRTSNRINAIDLRGTVSQEFFLDEDVEAGATYRYAVSAVDVSGNESPLVYSKSVTVRIASRGGDTGDALQLKD